MFDNYNEYDRETLYRQAWEQPMSTVAKSYGISDVRLQKICAQLDVPTPPRGYWAKVQAGQQPEKPELPASDENRTMIGRQTYSPNEVPPKASKKLASLDRSQQRFVVEAASKIEWHPHLLLRHDLRTLAKGGVNSDLAKSAIPGTRQFSIEESVSHRQIGRAAALIETLARAVEQVGGSMSDLLTFEVFGEVISFRVWEITTQVEHVITPRDRERIARYEGQGSRNPRRSANVRKWDHQFSGRLRFTIDTEPFTRDVTFKETEGCSLDGKLGDIFLAICGEAARKHAVRMEHDEEERQRLDRAQMMQQHVDAHNAEIDALNKLFDEAKRYELAASLRSYAEVLDASAAKAAEYTKWIRAKADWIDPLISKKDETFAPAEQKFPPEPLPDVDTHISWGTESFYYVNGRQPGTSWARFQALVAANSPTTPIDE